MESSGKGLIKAVFAERQAKWSGVGSLSLRAYAKEIGVSPATLSQTMSGQREMSVPLAKKILNDKKLSDKLLNSVSEFLDSRKEDLENRIPIIEISLEDYDLISDWYYFAILNLMECDGYEGVLQSIAKRLALEESVVSEALGNLSRLKLIYLQDGKWNKSTYHLRIDRSAASEATRKTQYQLMRKAHESFEQDEFADRDFSGTMMAIDKDLLPLAKEEIRKFRRNLTSKLERRGRRKNIYHLAVQFFPISKDPES